VPVAGLWLGLHTTLEAEFRFADADHVVTSVLERNVALANGTELELLATLAIHESPLADLPVGGELLLATVVDDCSEGGVLVQGLCADHASWMLALVALADGGEVSAVCAGAVCSSGGDSLSNEVAVRAPDAQVCRGGRRKLPLGVLVEQAAVQVLLMLGQIRRLLVDDDGISVNTVADFADQVVEASTTRVGLVQQHLGSHRAPADVTVVHGRGLVTARACGRFLRVCGGRDGSSRGTRGDCDGGCGNRSHESGVW
jgi:hypothetical protein